MMNTVVYVLKFADSSEWPGTYVALDVSSGGYPYSVGTDILRAQMWRDRQDALDYADSFRGGDSYRAYTIEQSVYILTLSVLPEAYREGYEAAKTLLAEIDNLELVRLGVPPAMPETYRSGYLFACDEAAEARGEA